MVELRKGAGILFVCTEDNTVLLLLRSKYVQSPGTWGVPGGKVELGEEFEETANRETIEELGSLPNDITPINELTNSRKDWIYKIFVVNISLKAKQNWNIKLNNEHDKYQWFPIGELPKNLQNVIDIIAL